MYISIANAIYSSTLQGSRGGFPKACFGLDYNAITSDFTFTRNSFATRVNEFGLIETVTNLGSDLVQNGSFDELGSELVTNGDFEDGENDWSFGGDWTLVNGTAEILTSTNSFLIQSNVVDLSIKTYKMQYEVVSTNGSNFRLAGGNSAFGTVTLDSSTVGVKTVYLTSNGTFRNLQFNQNAFRGSIDNVSVKQVDPNDDWSFSNVGGSNGWRIADGRAICDTVNPLSGRNLDSTTFLTSGKTYKLTLDILQSADGMQVYVGGTLLPTLLPTGTNLGYEYIINGADHTGGIFTLYAGSSDLQEIDNVSIQEVIEDDVPRIDYTGSTFDVPVYGDELLTDGVISNLGGGSFTFTANGVHGVSDGTSGTTLRPRLLWSSLTVGKQYRIIGTPTVNSGTTNYAFYNGSSYEKNQVAVESFDITFTCGGANVFFTNDGTQAFDINWDLSIKEVTAYTTTDKGAFLLEPISTNLILNSNIDNSIWSKVRSSVSTNEDAPTNNGSDGYLLTEDTSLATTHYVVENVTVVAGDTYTISAFIKPNGRNWVQLSFESIGYSFDIENGVVGTSVGTPLDYSINEVGNGFYRVSVTANAVDTVGRCQISILDADNSPIYDGDGVSGVYIYGVQLEELSYATSYIPTSGTTVTRAQESCVNATPTINSEEGVLYAEFNVFDSANTYKIIELNDGSSGSNRVLIYVYGGSMYGFVKSSGATNIDVFSVETVTDFNKVAVKWGTDETALWINGVEINNGTPTTFTPNSLDNLGFVGAGNQYFYGRTKDLKIYCKALTDEQLTELTAPPPTVYTDNLVASYSFDTDFSDYNGNNNLTASGDAIAGVAGGKVNDCLEVDGVDDYSIAADSDDFSFTNGTNDLPFSISVWANGDNLGTGNLVNKRIVDSNFEYQVFILSSQVVVNLFNQGSSSSQLKTRVFGTYNNNTWYNIIVTYDGSGNNSGLKVYVNGVLPTQTLDPVGTYVGMSNTTSPFTIGSFASGLDDFDGKIDEVHIWKNRELTSAEVLDIYNTENAGNSILP